MFSHRRLFQLFTNSSPTLRTMTSTTNNLPSIEVLLWLPARKIRDISTRQVVKREILSPHEAKRIYASTDNKGIDPWGHAASRVQISDLHQSEMQALRSTIIESSIKRSDINLEQAKKIDSFEAYLSWYPLSRTENSRQFTQDEQNEWLHGVQTSDDKVNAGKKKSLDLFNTEYSAFNSNYTTDVRGYGAPDCRFTFQLGLDFLEIVRASFTLMNPQLQGNKIYLGTASDSAMYYGMSLLKEHRLANFMLSESREKASISTTATADIDTLPIEPHVCTTASLFLIKAGLGEENYYNLVKRILLENPPLTHGFPMTDFMNAFFKELTKQLTHSPIDHAPQGRFER